MATVNNNSVRNNQVINDFGQKIGGAHKDRAREAADRLRMVDPSGLIAKPLAQVAKLPDLRALYLAGAITQEAARRAWWLWSQIGPKPAGSRPWRVRDWAQAAAGIIQAVADILAYGDSQKSQLPDGAREYQPADLFDEEMNAANWPAEDYKRGAYFVGRHWMGCGFSIHSHKSSYNKGFESVAACVDAIREKVGSNADRTPVAADFDIYKTRATGVYFVAPKSKPGIKLMQFDDFDAAYNYRREHPEALAERLAELRNLPAERHDWNRPRVGADYRNGKDLTPEAFADAFPFRGVEFGNWVTQLERAANLNECADALRDMAAVIGIKPEAVALGGSLAWAFGSRGVGRALAHYETGRRVINLTKKKGNGCVAHEWFHALDNYLMIQAGKPSLFMVADSRAYGNCEKSQLYTAAADLRCALQRSEMYTRSKRIDELKSKPYWATTTEMAARAFEAYILYKLEAAGICNDYLVSITPESDYSRSECYPYPTREEAAELAPLYDAFIAAAFSEAERAPIAEGVAYGEAEKSQISARLEEIRAAILAENVSYEETIYLQEHAKYIDPSDTILLEWAGVLEHQEDDEAPAVAASEPTNEEPAAPSNGAQGSAYGDSQKSQNSAKPRRKSVHDICTQYCRLRDELIKQCYPLNGVHLVRADKILEVYERYINNIHKFMKSDEWDQNKPFIREFYMLYRRPDVATLNKSMHICELDEKEFIDVEGKAHTYGGSSFGFFIPKKGWVSMPGDDGLPYSNSRETLKKIMDDGGYINFDGFQFVWPVMKGRDRSQKPVQPASIARKEWLEFKVHAMKVPLGCRQYVYEFIEKSLISAPEGVEWRIRHDSIWGIELKVDGVYFTVAYAFGRGRFYFDVIDVSSRFPSGICSPLSWCRYLDAAVSEHRIPMSWPRPSQFYAVEYHLPFDDDPVFAG
mgnify:CR=1 FL=1